MPELPEVELYGRYFASHALRQRISGVEVRDERILGESRAETFRRKGGVGPGLAFCLFILRSPHGRGHCFLK
ncbi:MAG TPA: DNA-formamidopyrimidine glycosylase family protein [Thermoanaerobaculia bacterium]|nr:DNA-formamidopyrimidine glycosylase family protein [Thermoanaerobaculia bacterium]